MSAESESPVAEYRWAAGTVVTFTAVIRAVPSDLHAALPPDAPDLKATQSLADFERQLAKELWEDKDFRARLQDESKKLFRGTFEIQLLELRVAGSVHLVAVLYTRVRQSVQVSAFRDKVERFADTLRQAIHDVGQQGLYDLVIDVTARGPVLDAAKQATADAATKKPQAAWDRISAVAAAVGTGIGVLGFVAFVGGAIEFARLDTAGLPAEEAVAVIPNANLVAIGANVLVPALALALGAAALLYVWEFGTAFWYRFRRDSDPVGTRPLVTREGLSEEVTDALAFAPTPGTRANALFVLFLVLETVAFLFLFDLSEIEVLDVLVFLALVGVTSGAVFLVALRTRAFAWVAVAAFLAAGIFWASLTYSRTTHSLKVRPAAAVADGNTTTGFFIAETDSQIYLGRNPVVADPRGRSERARILVLPKDEVSDLAIGPLMSPPVAYERTRWMAYELCEVTNQMPPFAIKAKRGAKRTECERLLLRPEPSPP